MKKLSTVAMIVLFVGPIALITYAFFVKQPGLDQRVACPKTPKEKLKVAKKLKSENEPFVLKHRLLNTYFKNPHSLVPIALYTSEYKQSEKVYEPKYLMTSIDTKPNPILNFDEDFIYVPYGSDIKLIQIQGQLGTLDEKHLLFIFQYNDLIFGIDEDDLKKAFEPRKRISEFNSKIDDKIIESPVFLNVKVEDKVNSKSSAQNWIRKFNSNVDILKLDGHLATVRSSPEIFLKLQYFKKIDFERTSLTAAEQLNPLFNELGEVFGRRRKPRTWFDDLKNQYKFVYKCNY